MPPSAVDVVKDLGNLIGAEYGAGGTQTDDELIASDRFGHGIGQERAVQEFIQRLTELAPKLVWEMILGKFHVF
jgi:hypothetical protein